MSEQLNLVEMSGAEKVTVLKAQVICERLVREYHEKNPKQADRFELSFAVNEYLDMESEGCPYRISGRWQFGQGSEASCGRDSTLHGAMDALFGFSPIENKRRLAAKYQAEADKLNSEIEEEKSADECPLCSAAVFLDRHNPATDHPECETAFYQCTECDWTSDAVRDVAGAA